MLWDDADALAALESLAETKERPGSVFLSSRYLEKSVWSLKQEIRDFTYLTYPFAFSPYQVKTGMGIRAQGDAKTALRQEELPLKDRVQTIASLSDSLTGMLTTALMDLRGNYYRDGLLDVIGTQMEQSYPLYGRIGFGAGQRYASRGCYIVQLSGDAVPQLIKKSDWETH